MQRFVCRSSEVALAIKACKPAILLQCPDTAQRFFASLSLQLVFVANTPDEAIQLARSYLEIEWDVEAGSSILPFVDDDAGYLRWVKTHPEGFAVNCTRNPTSAYLKLFLATRQTITQIQPQGTFLKKDYRKVCSLSRSGLGQWAKMLGGELSACHISQSLRNSLDGT